jgi:replicative DNA helicase
MGELYNGARAYLPVSERDSLRKALLKIKARRQGDLKSLKTSWTRFNDAFCDGLEWRTITVVGARPGTGKTLFMEQLVNDVIENNKDQVFRVLKFQFEMLDETNGIRKLSMNTGADYNTLMSKGQLIDKLIFQKCVEVYEKTAATDIVDVIYDPCTVDEMCATIHAYMEENKIQIGLDEHEQPIYNYSNTLVTIDHSGLFRVGKGEKDKFEMLYALGEALTKMKKRYPVAFVVLSQLNRNIDHPDRAKDGQYGNYVLDSDLFGADALLQHADVVVGINKPFSRKIRFYGPEKYIVNDEELLAFHFLKSRNGLTGLFFCKLDRTTVRIVEIDFPPTTI